MFRAVVAVLLFAVAAIPRPTSAAAASVPLVNGWASSWGASPLPSDRESALMVENQTLRQVVRVTRAGAKIRLRLTNEYGDTPLLIGAAAVSRFDGQGATSATFAGRPSVTVPPAAPWLSDPVDFPVQAGELITISLFVPKATWLTTAHRDPLNFMLISAPGDYTQAPSFVAVAQLGRRAFVSGVDVWADGPPRAVLALGDSITDPDCKWSAEPCRWSDMLAVRLVASGRPMAVSSQGISGNRVLSTGTGPSALARLERDVLAASGASHLIVFEGINDIGGSGAIVDNVARRTVTAEDLIAGYAQIIARAHARGLKVYGATLTPFAGSRTFTGDKEAVRQSVNQWIRASRAYDGVIDFDQAVSDPMDRSRLRPDFDTGDHLHPNPAGQRAMGEAIDLMLFR